MNIVLEIIAGILIVSGSIFIFLTAVGLVKMPDLYTRVSVTTKASTLGVGLVIVGTAVFFHDLAVYARSILIVIFVFMTSPVSSHMIGRAGYLDGAALWEKTKANHLEGQYDLKNKSLKNYYSKKED
ncbi:MAG: monovalent cation/H(+) antiporter subunit G [Ignavibacteria bacterium]|nr:monovalent cation/H(+) antiporter subunit G [Ignavibacteria bacterium]